MNKIAFIIVMSLIAVPSYSSYSLIAKKKELSFLSELPNPIGTIGIKIQLDDNGKTIKRLFILSNDQEILLDSKYYNDIKNPIIDSLQLVYNLNNLPGFSIYIEYESKFCNDHCDSMELMINGTKIERRMIMSFDGFVDTYTEEVK